MPRRVIELSRPIVGAPDDVWATLAGFDVGWHPDVATCRVARALDGGRMRVLDDREGGRLIEARRYLSHSDRVLRYEMVEGIQGAGQYTAELRVIACPAPARIEWRVEIEAGAERLEAIAGGTEAILATALDHLTATTPPGGGAYPSVQSVPCARPQRVMVDGAPRLAVTTSAAPTETPETLILCLHGIGAASETWAPQLAALGGAYPIAALDMRGYGGSALGEGPSDIAAYCADIDRVRQAFGAARLVLVGLSMGSWIATSYAMRYPRRLAALALMGGCTGLSEASEDERQRFLAAREAPLSQGQTPGDFAPNVIAAISGAEASRSVRDALINAMAAIPVAAYRDALRCFADPPERFDFARIACPVMMITGAEDPLAPPREIRGVAGQITAAGRAPEVRFEALAGVGHVCPLEAPDRVTALLSEWLSESVPITVP